MTPRTAYTDLLHATSNLYGLPFDLLEGQVLTESNGDPNALRFESGFFERFIRQNPNAKAAQYGPFAACSVGLLQIMVEVAYELGFDGRPEQLFDPKVGLAFGAKKMAALLAWTDKDYVKALCSYNGGMGITKTGPPYPNEAYAVKVYTLAGRSLP